MKVASKQKLREARAAVLTGRMGEHPAAVKLIQAVSRWLGELEMGADPLLFWSSQPIEASRWYVPGPEDYLAALILLRSAGWGRAIQVGLGFALHHGRTGPDQGGPISFSEVQPTDWDAYAESGAARLREQDVRLKDGEGELLNDIHALGGMESFAVSLSRLPDPHTPYIGEHKERVAHPEIAQILQPPRQATPGAAAVAVTISPRKPSHAAKDGAKRPDARGPSKVERRAMEKAIAEAKKCKGLDNATAPRVGAVLVRGSKIIGAAHRGEVDAGDHAEFVLLEKKFGECTLVGATLFTTLEPCTQRGHPKHPCAQRIVERHIKKVWIGMVDPNPNISGKGIRCLAAAGIDVQLFPKPLAQQVTELNRLFSRQFPAASPTSTLAD